MSENPPFLKWSEYTSKDQDHPDKMIVEVLELEPFETEYSVNIRANVDGTEKIVPIHSFESRNTQMLEKYLKAKRENKIRVGKAFTLLTWIGISKNRFPIRRSDLVF